MVWSGLLAVAFARPYTDIGFATSDVIETRDSANGTVRVHFSVDGPSATVLDDDDGDGTPDFPMTALEIAEDSLVLFDDLGIQPLVPESTFGLDLGGSPAIDVYMPDVLQGANGAWRDDACDAERCAGFLMVDHTFGTWWDPVFGLETVVPHEFFHGAQAAYAPQWPVWFSEGTASWVERQYVENSADFMGFANAYLEDVGRPVDRPPAGPVPSFAYGSCLFFDFLTLRHDPELMAEILELAAVDVTADPDADLLPAIDAALAARNDDLASAWVEFARYNLAVGNRAGSIPSYPYATRLTAPEPEVRAPFLDIEPRYFGYATVYHRLNHPGGPMTLWAEEDGQPVHLELFPATDDLDVQPSVWTGTIEAGTQELGDLPAGFYYLLGTVPEAVDQSISVRMCLGDEVRVAGCVPEEEEEPEGCGCQSSPVGGLLSLALLPLLLRRRR